MAIENEASGTCPEWAIGLISDVKSISATLGSVLREQKSASREQFELAAKVDRMAEDVVGLADRVESLEEGLEEMHFSSTRQRARSFRSRLFGNERKPNFAETHGKRPTGDAYHEPSGQWKTVGPLDQD